MSRPNPLFPVTSRQSDLRTIVAALDPSYQDKPPVYKIGLREFVDTTPSPLTLTGTPLAGRVDHAYEFQPVAVGGLGAKTYTIFHGDLSPLTLNAGTGFLSGTPSKVGTLSATLMVRDDNGNAAFLNIAITVTT